MFIEFGLVAAAYAAAHAALVAAFNVIVVNAFFLLLRVAKAYFTKAVAKRNTE